jgi:hypothetical protein
VDVTFSALGKGLGLNWTGGGRARTQRIDQVADGARSVAIATSIVLPWAAPEWATETIVKQLLTR